MSPFPPIRLRIDQVGDAFYVVHESSGKTLCAGAWDDVRHWAESPSQPNAVVRKHLGIPSAVRKA